MEVYKRIKSLVDFAKIHTGTDLEYLNLSEKDLSEKKMYIDYIHTWKNL